MTQKQLIKQIGALKEIKPRKEWAVLLKSQILIGSAPEKVVKLQAHKVSISNVLSSVLFQRKLAYAFALILFLIVGVFGFATQTMPGDLLFPIRKIAEQSQATLAGQTILKQDVAKLSNRINDLAHVAKQGRANNIPSAIAEINNNVSELVENLKNNSTDAATIKEIAVSLKTLADVPGTDLSASPAVIDLYQTLVQQQIADLEKSTLNENQQIALNEVKDLCQQEKYRDAFEIILIKINK